MSEVRTTKGLQELTIDELSLKLLRYLNPNVGVIKITANDLTWSELSDDISEKERFLFFQILGILQVGLDVFEDTRQTSNTLPIKNPKAWKSICNSFNVLQKAHLESSEMSANALLAAENTLTLFKAMREFNTDVNHLEIRRFVVLEQASAQLMTLKSFFTTVLEDPEKSRKVEKLEKQIKELALKCLQGTLKASYLRSSRLNWLSASKELKESLGFKVGVAV